MVGACNLVHLCRIICICRSVLMSGSQVVGRRGCGETEQAVTQFFCFQWGASPLPSAVLRVNSSKEFQSSALVCRVEKRIWGPNYTYACIFFQIVLLPSEVPGPNFLLVIHSTGLNFSFVLIVLLPFVHLFSSFKTFVAYLVCFLVPSHFQLY